MVVRLFKVIERLGVEGKLCLKLVLPQYLINARFGWAIACAINYRIRLMKLYG